MPTFEEHKVKYTHNKRFRDSGIKKEAGEFNDWEIVVIFYCVVHMLEGILYKRFHIDSEGHRERKDHMQDHPATFSQTLYLAYIQMERLAHTARYDEITSIQPRDVIKAQEYLDEIESWYAAQSA